MLKMLVVFATSLCIVLSSWVYYSSDKTRSMRSSSQVRQSMVQHQHAEQRIRRLGDGHTNPLLSALGEDISALQIRIAEFLAEEGGGSELSEWPIVYKQFLLIDSLPVDTLEIATDARIDPVRILRLDVQARLADAPEFLELIHGLYVEVGGWPVEVRACDLQRLPVQQLNVRCVLDIYHWSVKTNTIDG